MKIKSVILLASALLLSGTLLAQAPAPTPAPKPMTEKEVVSELKKQGAEQLIKDLNSRGVDFEMDADVQKKLLKAKATDQVVQAVTSAGPKERAAAAKAAAMANGEISLTPDEAAEMKTLESELDPDKAIALAEAFEQKHPQSPVLSYVYAFEANAYQSKGDAAKIVEYGEKSLTVKKDNLMSLLLVAYAIPTPQFLAHHQADEDKELTLAEGYCQDAYKAIDALKKPPAEPDADFAKRKATYTSSVHGDLGMIHLDRAQLGLMGMDKDELAKAVQEYKAAVSLTSNPDPTDYFRLGEAYRLLGQVDEAIAAFGKASETGRGAVKQLADQQIAALKKVKAQPAAPAKP